VRCDVHAQNVVFSQPQVAERLGRLQPPTPTHHSGIANSVIEVGLGDAWGVPPNFNVVCGSSSVLPFPPLYTQHDGTTMYDPMALWHGAHSLVEVPNKRVYGNLHVPTTPPPHPPPPHSANSS